MVPPGSASLHTKGLAKQRLRSAGIRDLEVDGSTDGSEITAATAIPDWMPAPEENMRGRDVSGIAEDVGIYYSHAVDQSPWP